MSHPGCSSSSSFPNNPPSSRLLGMRLSSPQRAHSQSPHSYIRAEQDPASQKQRSKANAFPDPRMSMSGRLSTDQNPAWAYGALPQYGTDGVPLTPTHGRRSSIYRAQNSTLFNAFEEGDNVPLTDLPEEDSEDEEEGVRSSKLVGGGQGVGRSLVGRRDKDEEGTKYPGYE